jgi:hypothetical protein
VVHPGDTVIPAALAIARHRMPGKAPAVGFIMLPLVLPGLIMGVMFLMPIIGRWNLGHRFNVAFTFAVLGGAGPVGRRGGLWPSGRCSRLIPLPRPLGPVFLRRHGHGSIHFVRLFE